jgi:hypothetical protein
VAFGIEALHQFVLDEALARVVRAKHDVLFDAAHDVLDALRGSGPFPSPAVCRYPVLTRCHLSRCHLAACPFIA